MSHTNFTKKFIDKINYFGDNTVLHGVGKVFSKTHIPTFKRLLWLVILALSAVGAAWTLHSSLQVFRDRDLAYSIETTYLDWDTPFPAVTICESINNDRINAYITEQKLPSSMNQFIKTIGHWSSHFCKPCTTCSTNVTCLEDIPSFVESYRFKCEDMLNECSWAGVSFPCCERFRPIETEYGPCFVFNSRIFSEEVLHVNRRLGLLQLSVSVTKDAFMRVHSPDDLVTVGSDNIHIELPLITSFDLILKAEQTIFDASVASIPASGRDCRLPGERPPAAPRWPFTWYTYSACVWYCRAMRMLQLCNCTHHFVPAMDGVEKCDISGHKCLFESNENNEFVYECNCPTECNGINYKLIHVFTSRSKATREMLERGSRGVVRFQQLPTLRVRRQVVRDLMGLVVDFGGVFGVFFGASVLCVVEIVYLFFIRW